MEKITIHNIKISQTILFKVPLASLFIFCEFNTISNMVLTFHLIFNFNKLLLDEILEHRFYST
jgi:hypothetical protein